MREKVRKQIETRKWSDKIRVRKKWIENLELVRESEERKLDTKVGERKWGEKGERERGR